MLARVVLNKLWRSHSAELLQCLHWLPVKGRIDFKVVLMYKVRNLSTLDYMNSLLTNHVINFVTFVMLTLLVLQQPQYGTNFLLMSKWLLVLIASQNFFISNCPQLFDHRASTSVTCKGLNGTIQICFTLHYITSDNILYYCQTHSVNRWMNTNHHLPCQKRRVFDPLLHRNNPHWTLSKRYNKQQLHLFIGTNEITRSRTKERQHNVLLKYHCFSLTCRVLLIKQPREQCWNVHWTLFNNNNNFWWDPVQYKQLLDHNKVQVLSQDMNDRTNTFRRRRAQLIGVMSVIKLFLYDNSQTLHAAKCHGEMWWKYLIIFPRFVSLGNNICINKRQSIQMCLVQTGTFVINGEGTVFRL